MIGMQNTYIDGDFDWSSRIIVSQSNFNEVSGASIAVPVGSYTLYYTSTMSYRLNAFTADTTTFYNPTTKKEFTFSKNDPLCINGLFNSHSFFSSFLVFNDRDFAELSNSLSEEYKASAYMLNVEDWKDTADFQAALLQSVVDDNGGQIFANWHNSAVFDKTGSKAEYLPYVGNESRIARVWVLYPLSKLSSTAAQFEAFATYLMLMLFIAIVAFVSSIMVIGLKLISTMWDDAMVYENLRRFGMKQRSIKELATKQMLFVYFIPTVLGCLIGAFTSYRIMLVSNVIYIGNTMLLVGGVCAAIFILQLVIFFVLRKKIVQVCRDYET